MDFLKEVLGEELYQEVANKLAGNDKIKLANLANGEYVSKDKYSASETLASERKAQLEAVNAQLADLKAKANYYIL